MYDTCTIITRCYVWSIDPWISSPDLAASISSLSTSVRSSATPMLWKDHARIRITVDIVRRHRNKVGHGFSEMCDDLTHFPLPDPTVSTPRRGNTSVAGSDVGAW